MQSAEPSRNIQIYHADRFELIKSPIRLIECGMFNASMLDQRMKLQLNVFILWCFHHFSLIYSDRFIFIFTTNDIRRDRQYATKYSCTFNWLPAYFRLLRVFYSHWLQWHFVRTAGISILSPLATQVYLGIKCNSLKSIAIVEVRQFFWFIRVYIDFAEPILSMKVSSLCVLRSNTFLWLRNSVAIESNRKLTFPSIVKLAACSCRAP